MPGNFSFVIPGKLAGLAYPGRGEFLEEDLYYLKREGIGAIVSLTPHPPEKETIEKEGFCHLHLPIEDFSTPTPEQIDTFIAFVRKMIEEGRGVAVHCSAGYGRTGTMLACYLVAIGESAEEAIESVRRIRPGSIETPEQEACVHAYAQRLQKPMP